MSTPSLFPIHRPISIARGSPSIDRAEDPTLAVAHLLAGGLMEVCGPLFWTALVGGFLLAEFALD